MENEGWLLILPCWLSVIFISLYILCSYDSHICHKYFIRHAKPAHGQVITNVRWHIRKMYFEHKFYSKAWFMSYSHSKEITFIEKYESAITIDTLISGPFLLKIRFTFFQVFCILSIPLSVQKLLLQVLKKDQASCTVQT